jgi:hypothetical protein
MVKIQSRIAKRSYLNGKRVYKYYREELPIPKKFHAAISSFLKLDLEMQLVVKGEKSLLNLKTIKATLDFPKK